VAMGNNGFDRFSKAWLKSGTAGDSTNRKYAENDIKRFKMEKSQDISRAINNSIILDFVLKGLLIIALMALAWFYHSSIIMLGVFVLLALCSVYFIFRELSIRKALADTTDYRQEVNTFIGGKIKFFRKHFPPLKWMLAFTSALFVWVGSLFYFYFKYGRYRLDDPDDVLVAVLMVALAYGISWLAYNIQFGINIRELEENLKLMEEEENAPAMLEAMKKRSRRILAAKIIFFVVGLALFVFLLLSFLQGPGS
jgi:Ca2+/Na+ antiporter